MRSLLPSLSHFLPLPRSISPLHPLPFARAFPLPSPHILRSFPPSVPLI